MCKHPIERSGEYISSSATTTSISTSSTFNLLLSHTTLRALHSGTSTGFLSVLSEAFIDTTKGGLTASSASRSSFPLELEIQNTKRHTKKRPDHLERLDASKQTELDPANIQIMSTQNKLHSQPNGNTTYAFTRPRVFNPTVQNFQPTTSSTNSITTITLSGRNMADENTQSAMSYPIDLADTDSNTRKNSLEIAHVKNVVARDMNILHNKILQLEKQQQQQRSLPDHLLANMEHGVYEPGGGFTPSQKMLTQCGTKDTAEAWLEDAKFTERIAHGLREQAYQLCPEWKPTDMKMIEAAPTTLPGNGASAAEFVCCKVEFLDVDSMVEHVQTAHATPQLVIVPESRSKAVEIKPDPAEGDPDSTQSPDTAVVKSPAWKPYALTKMPSVSFSIPTSTTAFSSQLLHTHFHGEQWSPGFWFVKIDSILPSKSYWLLNDTEEPFLPTTPGQHGAKLTPFFNDTICGAGDAPGEKHYENVPLFIQSSNSNDPGFRYFGNYSQTRYSDRTDYDTLMTKVPDNVRHYWAEQLSDRGRPEWVTQKLVEQFWPKPVYEGPISTSDASDSVAQDNRVTRAMAQYAEELAEWKKQSDLRVSLLNEQVIFDAFAEPDAGAEPGLRLWWEYMECVGWDEKFYDMLVQLKERHARGFTMAPATFKLKKPKSSIKEDTTPKKSMYPLTHPDGSAAVHFPDGRRKELPQKVNVVKPVVKTEKVEVDKSRVLPPHLAKSGTSTKGEKEKHDVQQNKFQPPHLVKSGTPTNGENVKHEVQQNKAPAAKVVDNSDNKSLKNVGDLAAAKEFSRQVSVSRSGQYLRCGRDA
jgi:hypothetical protein